MPQNAGRYKGRHTFLPGFSKNNTLPRAGCCCGNGFFCQIRAPLRKVRPELALGAQFFAEYTDVDAVIALGCVIQGDTRHFDFICQGVTQGITQLQIQWNMPIAFGVLTVNDMQQALDRCGGRHGNKGDEAAATAINMVKLQIDMEAASPDHEPDRRNIN